MSGYTADESVKNVTNPFSSMFLQKPYTGESLAKTVRDCLDLSPSSGKKCQDSLIANPVSCK
jgi:hypothetical protein